MSKEQVTTTIADTCALVLDKPTSNGGNTNDGPAADRFFDKTNRENICSVIGNEDDRHNYNILLCLFNKMLTIIQSCNTTLTAIPNKVQELGTALMVHIKEAFPFAVISPSIHQMAAHSGQLFEMTDGKPIAIYAEQSGEAWNKFIRAYKSGPAARARQCSIELNTKDIFTRIMLQTHPIIASKKRQIHCIICGRVGHSIIKCRQQFLTVFDEEDSSIFDCYSK